MNRRQGLFLFLRRLSLKNHHSQPSTRTWSVPQILCTMLALLLAGGNAFAWQTVPAPQPASSKPSKADMRKARAQMQWDQLRAVGPEKDIEVGMRLWPNEYQKTLRGHLERWSPGGLVLHLRNGKSVEIVKSEVQRVVLREKAKHGRRKATTLYQVRNSVSWGYVQFPVGSPITNQP
jgi:hypothetical protein